MSEVHLPPLVAVETLLSEGTDAGTIATAIEEQGIYTRDRFGRLVLADDDEKAAVLDALAHRLMEKRFRLARARPHDPSLVKITLELFGWPADKRPDLSPPEPSQPTEAKARGRTDNLKRAILDAWDSGLSISATASQTLDYLAKHDGTGFVVGSDGDELKWTNGAGGVSHTTLSALSERLTRLRREREGTA